MPRPSLRTSFVAVAVLVASVQLGAVTMASLPPNRYSDAVSEGTEYLSPFFTQNWRLFAPNPVAQDRSVAFQGSYQEPDGTMVQTPWIDWTDVELDLVHHRLVGGRAGYITNKLHTPLNQRFRALSEEQQQAAAAGSPEAPADWDALRSSLTGSDAASSSVELFLRYERSTTELATAVLMSRFPDEELVSVRYSLRSQDVTPYGARGGNEAERAAARPPETERLGGWRTPTPGSADQRAAVADFDRRHR